MDIRFMTAILILSACTGLILSVILFFRLRRSRSAPRAANLSREYRPHRTIIRPNLILEQLGKNRKDVIATFPLHLSRLDNVYISRSSSDGAGVCLKSVGDISQTVSRRHAVIAVDKQGFFIQDNQSANGMYSLGDPEPQEELSIHDGMIVYLGEQPIRFRIPCSSDQTSHTY